MANAEEEDEWEYEYDDTETEDFYITLDLSNVSSAGFLSSKPRAGHPVRLQSRLRALNAGRSELENSAESLNSQESATVGGMQVTGLHTSNPLVMYNGQLLSCKWASTIGTDMFFVRPNPETESQDHPLRSLPAVDLLAISSTKLIANVGRLRPRDDIFMQMADRDEPTTDAMDVSEDVQPAVEERQQPIIQDIEPTAQELRPPPTNFLSKLNQAKAKRGEKTRLVVSKTLSGSHLVAKENLAQPRASTRDVVMDGTD